MDYFKSRICDWNHGKIMTSTLFWFNFNVRNTRNGPSTKFRLVSKAEQLLNFVCVHFNVNKHLRMFVHDSFDMVAKTLAAVHMEHLNLYSIATRNLSCWAIPPSRDFHVADTNMLVSKNPCEPKAS